MIKRGCLSSLVLVVLLHREDWTALEEGCNFHDAQAITKNKKFNDDSCDIDLIKLCSN